MLKKIGKKSSELAKIALVEVWTESGKKTAIVEKFSIFFSPRFFDFYLQNDKISFLAIVTSFEDFLLFVCAKES